VEKTDLERFYKDFEMFAKDFCDESYIHTDPFIDRIFDIAGPFLFWGPLENLLGCQIE
jgi:hypothetical protein